MKVDLVRPQDLSIELRRRWQELQRQSAFLATPFLSPDFTLAVSRHRPDVEVAVLEYGRGSRGFPSVSCKRLWGRIIAQSP